MQDPNSHFITLVNEPCKLTEHWWSQPKQIEERERIDVWEVDCPCGTKRTYSRGKFKKSGRWLPPDVRPKDNFQLQPSLLPPTPQND